MSKSIEDGADVKGCQVDDSGELVGINHQAVDEIHTALVKARFTVAASPVPQNGEGGE